VNYYLKVALGVEFTAYNGELMIKEGELTYVVYVI